MPVRGLQSPFLTQRRAVAAQAYAHRREEVRLRRLPEALHEERSFGQTRETPLQRQVVVVFFVRQRFDLHLAGDFGALESEPVTGAGATINDAAHPTSGTASVRGLKDTDRDYRGRLKAVLSWSPRGCLNRGAGLLPARGDEDKELPSRCSRMTMRINSRNDPGKWRSVEGKN